MRNLRAIHKQLKWRYRTWRYHQALSYVGMIAAILILGNLLQITWLGLTIIALYGIFVLIRGIRSSQIFIMAIICLLLVPVLFVLKNTQLANTFSLYAFVLIVVATLGALAEDWLDEKSPKNR